MKKNTTNGSLALENESPVLNTKDKSFKLACDGVMANATQCGATKTATIPCDLLFVDTYQRRQRDKIKDIAQNWSDLQVGKLKVSYRDGTFWVFDGYQRLTAARIRGIDRLPCDIYENLSQKDEAMMLANQDENRTPISPYERLHAEASVGVMPGLDIMTICKNQGIQLVSSRRPAAGCCGNARKLVDIYRHLGREALIWVLDTIRYCGWSESYGGYSGTVLSALRKVYRKSTYIDIGVVRKRIAQRVNGQSPHAIIIKAQSEFPRKDSDASLAEYFLK